MPRSHHVLYVYRVLEATLPSLRHVNEYVLLLLLPTLVLIAQM